MQLRDFTLITPTIEAGQVFKAIESAIPIAVINQTLAHSPVKPSDNENCRLIWWCA
jgi:hypothetical protein